MRLAVRGIDRGSGYGNVAQELIVGFRNNGIEVVDHDQPAPAILHILPPHFFQRKLVGQRAWLLSMWETENCPEGFRSGFPNFEGVLCPTVNNLAAFSEYHDNVHRVNMGVDWKFWTPRPRVVDGPFRFLYTAHSPKRKGGDVAQQAANIVARTHDIEMVGAVANTDEQLRELFWSCHAYLQPSRGEGWGMMPHQAISSGMPAIISDCPGHREYAHAPGVYLTSTHPAPSLLTFHGEPGNWWEPDVESVVEQMLWVIDNYQTAHAEAQQAHEVCRREFDWTSIAADIAALIDPSGPNPDLVWENAKFTEFEIEVNRSLECDIGETHFKFQKGETYLVSADVKRVLREAGYIDDPDFYHDHEKWLAA